MKFNVMSHPAAASYSPVADGYDRAVIVRVTSLPDFMPLAHASEFKDVIYVKFDDTTEKTYAALSPDETKNLVLFDEGMAKKIVGFYHNWKDDCDVFVVHCDAGISRSSAIAIALAEYGNHLTELDRMTGSDGCWPNPWVWSTIRRVTGWDTRRQHEFEELFQFVESVHAHMA